MSKQNESYLSKLMDLSTQIDSKPDSSLKDQTKCLPSFLLTADLDEVNTNEVTNKKLSAPKRSQNQKSKFFSSENTVTDYQRQMMINSQVKSQFNKQIIYPNTQDDMGYYSPMNGYGYQQSSFTYPLHPPQPGTFMHNPSSFNYSLVNNINNLNFQINNTVIPRINSFNFVPPINTNTMLHTPTNRIQSQNNFFCNISQNNTISIPRMKKKSISPSKRGKKKAPKKSTADSETLSISNILSLNENELYSFIITQKGSRDIQSILKKVTEADVDALISKLTTHFSDIMIDKYGN